MREPGRARTSADPALLAAGCTNDPELDSDSELDGDPTEPLDLWMSRGFAGPDDPELLNTRILDHLARSGLFPPPVTESPR